MHRRAPAALVVGLVVALIALFAPAAPLAEPAGATPDATTPPTAPTIAAPTLTTVLTGSPTEPDAPPVTVSDFYPEDNDLSDCLGFVERPGCGSEARGGRGQTLVFVALAAGLALVFWRVAAGVRKNRRS